jgi:hypothetical protein
MFKLGKSYTRHQIHQAVGGSVQSYLPTKKGEVVAACLRKDLNPRAPSVIIVGRGPRIEAAGRILAQQASAVPVFLKLKINTWQYEGMFKSSRSLTTQSECASYVEGSGRGDVAQIILLQPV